MSWENHMSDNRCRRCRDTHDLRVSRHDLRLQPPLHKHNSCVTWGHNGAHAVTRSPGVAEILSATSQAGDQPAQFLKDPPARTFPHQTYSSSLGVNTLSPMVTAAFKREREGQSNSGGIYTMGNQKKLWELSKIIFFMRHFAIYFLVAVVCSELFLWTVWYQLAVNRQVLPLTWGPTEFIQVNVPLKPILLSLILTWRGNNRKFDSFIFIL